MNKLTIKLDESFRCDKSTIQNIFQWSNTKLVVLFPSEQGLNILRFTWVTPGGVKLEERYMIRDHDEDVPGFEAWSATIYPGMTAGIATSQDVGFAMVSFREDGRVSPLVRVPVDKTIIPDQSVLVPTNADLLNDRITELEEKILIIYNQLGI